MSNLRIFINMRKQLKKLANELSLPFVPLQEKFTEMGKKYGDEYYLYDGAHPTLAGSRLIADEWFKVCKEYNLL